MSLQWIAVFVCDALCHDEVPVEPPWHSWTTLCRATQGIKCCATHTCFSFFLMLQMSSPKAGGNVEVKKTNKQWAAYWWMLIMVTLASSFYASEPRISLLTSISTPWLKWFCFIFVMYARKKFSLNNTLSLSFVVFAFPRDWDGEVSPLSF